MKTRIAPLLALVSGLLLASEGLSAQEWSQLNAMQQRQLADFQAIWPQLPANRRAQLVDSAEQISRMTPANRKKLVDSMGQSGNNNADLGNSSPR